MPFLCWLATKRHPGTYAADFWEIGNSLGGFSVDWSARYVITSAFLWQWRKLPTVKTAANARLKLESLRRAFLCAIRPSFCQKNSAPLILSLTDFSVRLKLGSWKGNHEAPADLVASLKRRNER